MRDGIGFENGWARVVVQGRPDIIGIRTLSNGWYEFLVHDEALSCPYYLASSGGGTSWNFLYDADKHAYIQVPIAEPSPEPEAAAASEAKPGTSALYVTKAAYDARLAELAQLRARVAILDAQKVELPELLVGDPDDDAEAIEVRERQLLDALRAIQACREVAQQLRILFNDGARIEEDGWPVGTDAAIAAYDALAGKGE